MRRRSALKRNADLDDYLKLTTFEPPSGALINAVLEHADVRHDLGAGRTLLRLSRRRLKDPAIRRSFGRQARRLGDLSLVWDDEACQVIEVCDDAAVRDDGAWSTGEPSELDTFELTEAALAYVAEFERRRA